MSGYPMISSHITNKEVSNKKIGYPMNYMVTTVSHRFILLHDKQYIDMNTQFMIILHYVLYA